MKVVIVIELEAEELEEEVLWDMEEEVKAFLKGWGYEAEVRARES